MAGARLPIEVALVTGVAKLLGDALSMGMGDAMSEGAEHAYIRGERKREVWEYANYPEGEKREMRDIYMSKGFTEAEATTVVDAMTRKPEYTPYFIDHMMVQELGQVVPDEGDNPVKDGIVSFVSFVVFGFLPLLAYVVFWAAGYEDGDGQLGIGAAVTLGALFVLGMLQAWIIKQPLLRQGTYMAINGGLAAGAAYLIGWGLHKALGAEEC